MARGKRGLFRRVHGPAGREHRLDHVPVNNTVIMRTAADSSASLLGGLHLGNPDKSGHGYAGVTQARLASIVLTVVFAATAAIALASRARGQTGRSREADPSGADR